MRTDVGGGLESADADRHCDAGSNVVAERDGTEETRAINIELLTGRQRGGHDGSAGVGFRRRMRIVGLVRMREHRIRERSFNGSAHHIGCRDGGSLLRRMGARKIDGEAAWREFGAGDHGGEAYPGCAAWCSRVPPAVSGAVPASVI